MMDPYIVNIDPPPLCSMLPESFRSQPMAVMAEQMRTDSVESSTQFCGRSFPGSPRLHNKRFGVGTPNCYPPLKFSGNSTETYDPFHPVSQHRSGPAFL